MPEADSWGGSEGETKSVKAKPVVWKPRYATRRMRELAWAKADLERERAAASAGRRISLFAWIRRR
jgi:hypothetical protein